MAGTKEIKRRIKSVKNTKKITKAMELVAASKMKRAVSATLASRVYAEYSWDVLTSVARNFDKLRHPLFAKREKNNGEKVEEKVLLILITSNRGLCGAYNAQIIKKTISLLKLESDNLTIDFVTIGKKGDAALRRVGKNVVASFSDMPDTPTLSSILPVSRMAIEEFSGAKYDRVLVAYTDFLSALSQRPNIRQVLPISKESLKEFLGTLGGEEEGLGEKKEEEKIDYLIEGNSNSFLGLLAEKVARMQIYQMILESNASEQSARMMAMKNASEASSEMIDDLTLMFNKARQANITREISEISAGMASLN